MPDPKWNHGRSPLADEVQEDARRADYWDWIAGVKPHDKAETVADASRGGRWVRLADEQDADFEAKGIRHSIGYSWSHYSGFGDIFSLRDAQGAPQATILVSKGTVIHAREHENARLSQQNQADLEVFAESLGWAIKPDPYPFDLLRTTEAPNTRLTYLTRDAANTKTFTSFVMAGRLDEDQVNQLVLALGTRHPQAPGNGFDKWNKWIRPQVGWELDEGRTYELQALRDTWEDPTVPLAANELAASIRASNAPATASANKVKVSTPSV